MNPPRVLRYKTAISRDYLDLNVHAHLLWVSSDVSKCVENTAYM